MQTNTIPFGVSHRGFTRTTGMVCIALSVVALATLANASTPPPITLTSTTDRDQAVPLLKQSIATLEEAVKQLETQRPDVARQSLDSAVQSIGAAQHVLGNTAAHRPRSPWPLTSPPSPSSLWDDGWGEPTSSWNPFEEVRRMQDRIHRMFDDSMGRFQMSPAFTNAWRNPAFSPAMDVADDGDHYTVRFDVPGVDKSQINVRIEDRILTVSGSTETTMRHEDPDKSLRVERRAGQFQRSLTLPGPVESDKLDARYADGVLTVTVPKASEGSKSKTVPVI